MYEGKRLCRSQAGETLLQQLGGARSCPFVLCLFSNGGQIRDATVTNGEWLSGVPVLEHPKRRYPLGLTALSHSLAVLCSWLLSMTVSGDG